MFLFLDIPDLRRSRLGLVRLLTRSAKARFGQVEYQVSQEVKEQVGQGQGQELVNICGRILVDRKESFQKWKKLSELFHKD